MRVKTEQNMWNITFQRPWKINEKLDAPIENLLFYFHCFAMSTFYWDAQAEHFANDRWIHIKNYSSVVVQICCELGCTPLGSGISAKPLRSVRKLVDEMFSPSNELLQWFSVFQVSLTITQNEKVIFCIKKVQTALKSLHPRQPETREPSGTFISRQTMTASIFPQNVLWPTNQRQRIKSIIDFNKLVSDIFDVYSW